MKRIILVIFIVLFGSTLCYAADTTHVIKSSGVPIGNKDRQPRPPRPPRDNNFGKRVTLGLAFGIGPNWLNPRSDSLERDGTTAMLKYGIPVDINFTTKENYYFSTGIFFQHGGGKFKFEGIPFEGDSLIQPLTRKYSAIYVSIPTGIKLKTPNIKGFVVGGNFGLLHSFRLTAKAQDTYMQKGEKQKTQKFMYKDETFVFRESGYIGLGLEYVIQDACRIYFYANYVHSFTNFFNAQKSHHPITNEANKATNGGIEFQIGLCF